MGLNTLQEEHSLLTSYRLQAKFAKVMFLHMSVCHRGGIPACLAGGIQACLAGLQGVVSKHALQVSGGSPGPHPGGKLRGLAEGGLQAHTRGVCIPACTEADPPGGWLLLRVVCILLECILVHK